MSKPPEAQATPETDVERDRILSIDLSEEFTPAQNWEGAFICMVDHARSLERRLAEAEQKLLTLNHAATEQIAELTTRARAAESRLSSSHAARVAAEADARRYRWLRDAVLTTDCEFFIGVDSDKYPSRWALNGDEADAAIDAAMALTARPSDAEGGETRC